jgi:hypothetical protein
MKRATKGAARQGVRALKSLVPLLAAAAVAGCGERPPADPASADPPPGSGTAKIAVRQAADMQLWSVQAVGIDGARGRPVLLCADGGIRTAFSQGVPAVDGQACRMEGEPIESEGLYTGRCRIGDQLYVFRTVTDADPDGSVVVHSLVRELQPRGGAVSQSRLFRPLGGCPEGWRNGDSAAPNASQVRNVVSDETRALDTPAPGAEGG